MEQVAVETLKGGSVFSGDLYVDEFLLLLPAKAQLEDSYISALKEWGFETILCENSDAYEEILNNQIDDAIEYEEEEPEKEKIGDILKAAIEDAKSAHGGSGEQSRINMVEAVYNAHMDFIENLFTLYATNKEIDQGELATVVQSLCMFVKEHQRYILRLRPTPAECGKNYLITHTMRVTVLAIAMGLHLRLPLSKMIELGMSSILHEIGMLRLPPPLYLTDKQLTPGETAQILKHPILGYTILKDLEFSLPIQVCVLEHHEKENGKGYPRHLQGDKISSTGKILAVACYFETSVHARKNRPESAEFDTMIELIQNKEQAFNDSVIKALLLTISLYPLGTYVYLSNRKVAIVADTNPSNPKCPVVQLLTERESDGSLKLLKTSKEDVYIVRILSEKEKHDILKLVEEKYSNIAQAAASTAQATSPQRPAPAPAPKPAAPKNDGLEEVDISEFS